MMLPIPFEINSLLSAICPGERPETTPASLQISAEGIKSERRPVMILERDTDVRETLAEILEYEGYEVCAAASVDDLLRLVEQGLLPAVMLLDATVPEVQQSGLAPWLKQNPSLAGIPIVVMSGDCDLRAEFLAPGMAGCLSKPVHVDHLLDIVTHFCR